jgi:hypothetical protein
MKDSLFSVFAIGAMFVGILIAFYVVPPIVKPIVGPNL